MILNPNAKPIKHSSAETTVHAHDSGFVTLSTTGLGMSVMLHLSIDEASALSDAIDRAIIAYGDHYERETA